MVLTYLVAAVVAAAAAYGAADFERLPYWRRWDRGMVRATLALICAFFAVVGLGLTALAQHLDWVVAGAGAGRALANGLAYGGVAFVLLRVEFNGFGLSQVGPARSLLKFYLARIDPRLTRGADRNVRRRLGDLKPKQLCEVSLELFLRHAAPELRDDVLAEELERLMDLHIRALAVPDPDNSVGWVDAHTARGLLRYRCERLIVDNHDSEIETPRRNADVPPRTAHA